MMDGSRSAVNTTALHLRAPTVWDIGYLAHNLRPDEIEQFMASAPFDEYDADRAARILLDVQGPTFIMADCEDLPVLACGFRPINAGTYECWMAGTMAGWETHGLAITRMARRLMDQWLARPGVNRLQVPALASRIAAQHWYQKGLKMQYEGTHRCYGKGGEDIVMYARVKRADDAENLSGEA